MNTAVIRPDLTADEAHTLTTRIRERVADLLPLIREAYERRAWVSLGHESWEAYCDAELTGLRLPVGQRPAAVAELRGAGMSTRAIGAALGVDPKTVRNDLATGEFSPVGEVIGANGKRYTPTRPATERVSAPVDTPTDSPADDVRETYPIEPTDPIPPSIAEELQARIEAKTRPDGVGTTDVTDRVGEWLAGDPTLARTGWQKHYMGAIADALKVLRFRPEQVAEYADRDLLEEARRLVTDLDRYVTRCEAEWRERNAIRLVRRTG